MYIYWWNKPCKNVLSEERERKRERPIYLPFDYLFLQAASKEQFTVPGFISRNLMLSFIRLRIHSIENVLQISIWFQSCASFICSSAGATFDAITMYYFTIWPLTMWIPQYWISSDFSAYNLYILTKEISFHWLRKWHLFHISPCIYFW